MTRTEPASPLRPLLRALFTALLAGLLCLVGAPLLVAVLARQVVERGRYPLFDEAPTAFLVEWARVGLEAAWPAAVAIFAAVFLLGLLARRIPSAGWRKIAVRALWATTILLPLALVGITSDRLRDEVESHAAVEPGALPPPVPYDEPAPSPDPVRADAERPDVVLITVDTLRAGHLGYEGYERPTSPNIDRLAERGVAFTAAIAQAPMTRLSVASLLTGLHTHVIDEAHQQQGRVALAEGFHSLAERLRADGYLTAGFVSNRNLKRGNGFAQGFEHFDQNSGMYGGGAYRRSFGADEIVDAAMEWMEETRVDDDRPIFLWLHILDPHHPYEPDEPGPWEDPSSETFQRFEAEYRSWSIPKMTRHIRWLADDPSELRPGEIEYLVGRYDAEILQTDRQVGRFLEFWAEERSLDETLLVLTSDHGEEFHEHGGFLHAHALFDELIHVPLVVAGPGFDHGRPVDVQVSLLDVAPTILRGVGLLTPALEATLAGDPLQELVTRPGSHRLALSYLRKGRLALRTGEHKLVGPMQIIEPGCPGGDTWSDLRRLYRARYLKDRLWPEQELEVEVYDLVADPGETTLETDPLELHRVVCTYANLLRREPYRPPVTEETQKGLSEEDKESLRALGYVVD